MSGQAHQMSRTTRDLLLKARNMVPPMLEKFHKGTSPLASYCTHPAANRDQGQMGRVAVIGGSEDYTGAPYFSAIASAKLGADMSHVICTPQAAQVIKTYSPNLMVHPLMRQTPSTTTSSSTVESTSASVIAKPIIEMLPRLHVLVIGPGLGRDPLMQETCAKVIEAAKERGVPFVLDADGLGLVQTNPQLVQGCKECILTPNIVEFGRLCKAKNVDLEGIEEAKKAEKLAKAMGGVTILQKGPKDYISDGERTLVSDIPGGLKRSGGQGDTLTGTLATFLAWRKAYLDKIWDHDDDLTAKELLTLSAFAGSSLTRECSRLAFSKKGRSMQASDLTEEIFPAFTSFFEGDGPGSKL